jgi:hypothetical protein
MDLNGSQWIYAGLSNAQVCESNGFDSTGAKWPQCASYSAASFATNSPPGMAMHGQPSQSIPMQWKPQNILLHKLKLSGYLQTKIVHSCAPRIEPRFLRMCLHIVWTKEPLFLYVFVKFRACIEQLVDVL